MVSATIYTTIYLLIPYNFCHVELCQTNYITHKVVSMKTLPQSRCHIKGISLGKEAAVCVCVIKVCFLLYVWHENHIIYTPTHKLVLQIKIVLNTTNIHHTIGSSTTLNYRNFLVSLVWCYSCGNKFYLLFSVLFSSYFFIGYTWKIIHISIYLFFITI